MALTLLPQLSDFSAVLGVLGFLVLVIAPGAWITFGLPLNAIPLWARFLTGATLSPLVVCAEFYALRAAGIPFGPTCVALVFLNLPAAYLIWKRLGHRSAVTAGALAAGAAAVLISALCMTDQLIHVDARMYSPHAWVYADPVYLFARGDLVLEDPSLAGIRLGYPVWSALVFQGVHSYLVNSPPVSAFVWQNLLWLIVIYGFTIGITKELGGGRLAQVSAGVLLLVGTNPVGYVLARLAPPAIASMRIWGDRRYTPWVTKFGSFSTMPLGLAMLAAIIYLLVRPGPLNRSRMVCLALLVSGIGLFYPLLLPPACGLLAAKALAAAVEASEIRWTIPRREWLSLAGILLVALVVTYAQVKFLTSDRQPGAPAMLLSTVANAARKVIASFIATSVLCAGLALVLRDCWRVRRHASIVLLGAALAGYVLHAAFNILYWANEYKFIFAVTMCLAGFAGLAVEHAWRRFPARTAVPVLGAAALVVLVPYAHHVRQRWHWVKRYGPQPVDARGFYLRPKDRNWAGLCDAARRLTPADSVLLAENSDFYFPALTSRTLYVPAQNRGYPGVTLPADVLLGDVRGNGHAVLADRRAVMTDLFDAPDPSRREAAFMRILALKRPLALVLEPRHAGLREWLATRRLGVPVYAAGDLCLWIIREPAQASLAASGGAPN